MSNADDWVILGRFGRAHGIKGFITVHSFTEPRENILQYPEWYVLMNKQWQPLHRCQVDITEKHILVSVTGFNEREQLAKLTNIEIGVPKEQLPQLEQGEFYWHQLIGMQVVNQAGDVLGNVTEMLSTGSNDILVIKGIKQYLVPYLPGRFIVDVNVEQHLITVDWDKDF